VKGAADKGLPDPATEPTVSVPRAGQILGIGRATAYTGVKTGELPAIRIGGRIVVPTAALLRLLEVEAPPTDRSPPDAATTPGFPEVASRITVQSDRAPENTAPPERSTGE